MWNASSVLSVVLGLGYLVVINSYGSSSQGASGIVGEKQKEASVLKYPIIVRNVKDYE